MPLFESLTHQRDLFTAFDPLQDTSATATALDSAESDAAIDATTPDWASLDRQFDDTGVAEAQAGGDASDIVAIPDVAGTAIVPPDLTPLAAWPDGLAGFGLHHAGDDAGAYGVLSFLDSGGRTSSMGEEIGDAAVAPGDDFAAAAGGAPDVMIVGGFDFAKGGNGNGGGGGGKPGGGGGDPAALDSYTSAGAYNVEINFKGEWTVQLQQAFIDSADLLSSIILSDIPDVFFRGKVIDDIKIDAKLSAIDGPGGILGQAGPTAVRTDGYLPATAIMEFDSADAETFDGMGLWDDIVLHEMTHSIGFGTIWDFQGLLSGAGTTSPLFTGANATLAYESDSGVVGAAGVPLEFEYGAGTNDSHWLEATFDNELMTGIIDSQNVVSNMTIASLEDLGYDTVWDASDPGGDFMFV